VVREYCESLLKWIKSDSAALHWKVNRTANFLTGPALTVNNPVINSLLARVSDCIKGWPKTSIFLCHKWWFLMVYPVSFRTAFRLIERCVSYLSILFFSVVITCVCGRSLTLVLMVGKHLLWSPHTRPSLIVRLITQNCSDIVAFTRSTAARQLLIAFLNQVKLFLVVEICAVQL